MPHLVPGYLYDFSFSGHLDTSFLFRDVYSIHQKPQCLINKLRLPTASTGTSSSSSILSLSPARSASRRCTDSSGNAAAQGQMGYISAFIQPGEYCSLIQYADSVSIKFALDAASSLFETMGTSKTSQE